MPLRLFCDNKTNITDRITRINGITYGVSLAAEKTFGTYENCCSIVFP